MFSGCALDELGNLKNPSDIEFFNSETDTRLISGPTAHVSSGCSIGQRSGQGPKMAALVAVQGLGSDGEPETAKKSYRRRPRRRGTGATASRKRKSNKDDEDSEAQDGDFAVASSDSESSDDSQFTGDEVVGNAELASILPSKSIPTTGRGSGSHTRKRKATEVEHGADGNIGEAGDKHYKCYHGNSKIFTLKKTGKSNLTSMVNNLKACSPQMYCLYSILKERPADQPVTEDKLAIAAGSKVLDPIKAKEYFRNLKVTSENICTAFEKQSTNAAVRNWPMGSRKI
ncbi:hypothetical protein BYT27DRAFT_7226184 [Phlegmacium glaucopus]|nr:hypothetical protein BYT27DRAFT_7226184 [Phlegmacium glaucopus]